MSLEPTTPLLDAPSGDLARLKGRRAPTLDQEKIRLRKATKEFEAFFMYYMLKTMRETVPDNPLAEDLPFSKSLGKDTFNQLFDMEISRSMTSDGKQSISDLLYNSFEKLIEAQYRDKAVRPEIKPLREGAAEPIKLRPPQAPLRVDPEKAVPKAIERKSDAPRMLPIASGARKINDDPIRARYGAIIDRASQETSLDSAVIASVIRVESNGDAKALSPAGAKGLMQLIDSTAEAYGVKDAYDPGENVMAGSRYLKDLLDRYGDLELALAAYNAGPGNVNRHGGVPPFRETREYLKRVTAHLSETGVKIDRVKSKE